MGTSCNEENSRQKSVGGRTTMRAVRHCNIGPVKPPLLEIFRACLGKVQSNLSDTAVRRGWHRDLPRLPLI